MPYSKHIEEQIDALIRSWADIEKKKMFGGICYLLNGNMCFGIWKDYLIVRAGVETAERMLQEKRARPFDITGKPMKGWLMVEQEEWRTPEELGTWLTVGREFALTLPEK
jgi:TfoX/Sxy family transcriptional regulator of competence genes